MPDDDPQNAQPTEIGDIDPAALLARAMTPPAPSAPADAWVPPSLDALHRALPQYEIVELAGRGAMGAVYKGWQKSLERHVAIKVLPAEMGARDPDFAARFKREAKAMARLAHPNIVVVHDAGETSDGLLYFVMDFVEGTDVQRLVDAQGRLAPGQALAIAAQVCDALAYAHGKGVIHRDIKPSNVMLDAEGRVKVADFGLAKMVNAESGLQTATDLRVGTPAFMAPEALGGVPQADHRADLYAVGVMLYQMLTGQLPRGRFEMPSGAVPQVDPRCDSVVDKAMQADREKRYGSAIEMKRDLDAVAQASAASAATAPRSPGRWLAAAALVVLGAGGWLVWDGRDQPAPESASLAPAPAADIPAPKPEAKAAAEVPGPQVTADGRLLFPVGVWTRNRDHWKDGEWYLGFPPSSGPDRQVVPMTNLGLRVRLRGQRVQDWIFPQFNLRGSKLLPGLNLNIISYEMQIRTHEPDFPILARERLREPLTAGQEYDMEFYAIGTRIFARVNGQLLAATTHLPPTPGLFSLTRTEKDYFQNFHIVNLDGLSEAEALKAAGLPASPGS